jgi:hypothetical protein
MFAKRDDDDATNQNRPPEGGRGGGNWGGVARRFGLIDDLDCFLIDFRLNSFILLEILLSLKD